MRRGTTPTHIFDVSIDTTQIKQLRVIYQQDSRNILTKTESDCLIEPNRITIKLSQRETLAFVDDVIVKIQIRALLNDDTSIASDVMRVSCKECLSEEILE